MEMFWYLLALVWGVAWALFLQLHPTGKWLAIKRTWITVIVGVGANLGIVLGLLYCIELGDPVDIWLRVVGVFGLSSVGVVGRSLANEQHETEQEIDEATRG